MDELNELCSSEREQAPAELAGLPIDRLIIRIVAAWCISSNAEEAFAAWVGAVRNSFQELWNHVRENERTAALGCWYILLLFVYFNVDRMDSIETLKRDLPRMQREFSAWWYANALVVLGELMMENGGDGGLPYAEQALEIFLVHGGPFEQARAMTISADMTAFQGNYEKAESLLAAADRRLAAVDSQVYRQSMLWSLANVYRLQGRHKEAFEISHIQQLNFEKIGSRLLIRWSNIWESLNHSRYGTLEEAFVQRRRAMAISTGETANQKSWDYWELGELYRLAGDPAEARRNYELAYALFKGLGIEVGIGYYYRGLGALAMMEAEYQEAMEHYRQSLGFSKNHLWSQAMAACGMSRAAVGLKRWDEVEKHFDLAFDLSEKVNLNDLRLICVLGLAEIAAGRGRWESAVELAALVAGHFSSWNETRNDARALIETASGHLSPEAVESALDRGQSLSLASLDPLIEIKGTAIPPE